MILGRDFQADKRVKMEWVTRTRFTLSLTVDERHEVFIEEVTGTRVSFETIRPVKIPGRTLVMVKLKPSRGRLPNGNKAGLGLHEEILARYPNVVMVDLFHDLAEATEYGGVVVALLNLDINTCELPTGFRVAELTAEGLEIAQSISSLIFSKFSKI